uniref:Uncharacterized protein n=1 Tax=Anguilla anguilla TaxID=7936 RepID=A0A0E9U590_ANGAN
METGKPMPDSARLFGWGLPSFSLRPDFFS